MSTSCTPWAVAVGRRPARYAVVPSSAAVECLLELAPSPDAMATSRGRRTTRQAAHGDLWQAQASTCLLRTHFMCNIPVACMDCVADDDVQAPTGTNDVPVSEQIESRTRGQEGRRLLCAPGVGGVHCDVIVRGICWDQAPCRYEREPWHRRHR